MIIKWSIATNLCFSANIYAATMATMEIYMEIISKGWYYEDEQRNPE